MQRKILKIGITAGDPAGIGPEVALKAIHSIRDKSIIPVLIGRSAVFDHYYADMFKGYEPYHGAPAAGSLTGKRLVVDVPVDLPLPVPGNGGPDTGRESLAYFDRALDMWKAGEINAIVTGPVNKGNIEKTGVSFTGHTEYMAARIGSAEPFMMMFSRRYRVLLVTMHVPVSEISGQITVSHLLKTIRTGYDSIRSIDGVGVAMAIAGFDPHCGDDGAIGTFDKKITARAVRAAQKEGIPIEGPLAADTLFIPATWERYNLVIAHYHDQGLIPFKMLAFDDGVNVTLGLTAVRTSPDHGTAYDIAGKNLARHTSMTEAIRLAYRLAAHRGGVRTR